MSDSGDKNSRFYVFSIYLLAIEWIAFGSMHFSFHAMTVKQIPDIFGASKDMLATISGMLEVTAGMLIVPRSTRLYAAILSLALLVLLFPAMYHIVSSDKAVDQLGAFAGPFRAVLMPNNILMAMASVCIVQTGRAYGRGGASYSTPTAAPRSAVHLDSASASSRPSADAAAMLSSQTVVFVVGGILLLANIAGFAAIVFRDFDRSVACLWAMACLAMGAVIGFLFAVPKVNAGYRDTTPLRVNSNIDAISDWLTKIIVGVGLINLGSIMQFVVAGADTLAHGLSKSAEVPGDKSFALGLILYFFAAGMIEGYLLTRMYLARYLDDAASAG